MLPIASSVREQVLAEYRNDKHAQVLAVLRDRHAKAVVDGATRGRHELEGQPVLVGKQPVVGRFQDLELVQPPAEQAEQPDLRRSEQDHAAGEAMAQAPFVAGWAFVVRDHVRPRKIKARNWLPCLIQSTPRSTTGKSRIDANAPKAIGRGSIQRM